MARLLAAFLAVASGKLQVVVDEHCGYVVNLDGALWLEGGDVRLGKSTLSCSSKRKGHGTDALGVYSSETLVWSDDKEVLLETSFRHYDDDFVVFEQHFVRGMSLEPKPWGSDLQTPHSLFPSFRSTGAAKDLDCFAYHNVFPSMKHCTLGSYEASHQGGAPLVIYNASKGDMTVFSPLSSFKAQQMFAGDGLIGSGVKGTVKEIPAAWSQLYLLSAGHGIVDGMMAWGDRMLKFTGKPRPNMYGDEILGSIGFWTDNGGYYHYATGSNETYEEVLPKVKAYHESLKIPFTHWQFDSWFYPKDGKVDPGGGGGAVVNWTALPEVFPHGMAYIQSKLKVPMGMHNRQWSPHSDYVKHEAFKWYKSKTAAVPEDPEAFFRWFFTQQEGWGLAMYEQDWMCTEYNTVEALQTNISLADLWLKGMAVGAKSSGRTVQYCMPYPYDVLAASALDVVTNARASDDYIRRDKQWAIGATSMFYWAIGVLPFKDGFYSSTLPQRGGQVVGPETHPNRAALMAVLSGATVGPMDGLGFMNASRVMSTCRGDGRVLKPDRPVMPLESCFAPKVDPASCFKYSTYSDIPGLGRVFYVYMDAPGTVHLSEVVQDTSTSYALYDWYSSSVTMLNDAKSFTLSAGYEGHGYGMLVPVIRGLVLLGDRAKLVPLSSLRFHSLRDTEVELYGVADETVEVCAAQEGHVMCQNVRFAEDGLRSVHFGTLTFV